MKRAYFLFVFTGMALFTTYSMKAAAQEIINDPTRPPAMMLNNAADAGGPTGSLLQSIMITPTQRSAIIGGERVVLGGKYGDARVVRITESEVVLHSSAGAETLSMYPDVDIKPAILGHAAGSQKKRKASNRNNAQGKQQ